MNMNIEQKYYYYYAVIRYYYLDSDCNEFCGSSLFVYDENNNPFSTLGDCIEKAYKTFQEEERKESRSQTIEIYECNYERNSIFESKYIMCILV